MELLELLKSRLQVAKTFTKDYHDEVEKCIADYECKLEEKEKLELLSNINSRYQLKIPYIFATQESMISTLFDKTPELIMTGKGKLDKQKASLVEGVYNYLKDVCDLEGFKHKTAWWFILTGNVSATGSFKSEYNEIPLLDIDGNPLLDAEGKPITQIEYTYNDPVVEVDDPKRTYFSPESEFNEDGTKVPYTFTKILMEKEEVKNLWGVEVTEDSEIDIKEEENDKLKNKDDIKRVCVYIYLGSLPEEIAEDSRFKELKLTWKYGKHYFIALTEKQVLFGEEFDKPRRKFGKWHGRPNSFLGFGIGNRLRSFQKELSIRRGQQLRYGDVAAFPKIAVDELSNLDEKALNDPRENVVLLFKDKPPVYLTPPPMSETLIITEQKAREDAQFVSGMLDLSKGAQESTVVKTATGQSIFADMSEKRMKQAKRQYSKFYKAVVIMLLELCRDNWDEEKIISITDENGETQERTIDRTSLQDIDFNRDIDFEMESSTVNRETMRANAVALYTAAKDEPFVDKEKLFKMVLRDGFGEKNPDQYILSRDEIINATMVGGQNTPVAENPTQMTDQITSQNATMGA